ncbi:orotate phosphoribosyltransferase [Salimicrobium flavidum]|uniref:Orotate phosphoribosyltransferase n=1 Tax=Salimicrobium flavidum TaxID=570947 RepID=A0A1N7IL66_9BACI|nr:orotate phosphoribosyltransferase [Salimicrobium flavidum]SIS37843.1 orotate phosphoribosyltransferase [Salimicrobium flavidum]
MNLTESLMYIGAIQIDTDNMFTWSSGIKSPIYCDNRLTISYPVIRKEISRRLARRIQEFPGHVDVIAGCATAGIPHAAWVAEELGLPMVYVRGSKKSHGKENLIEGVVKEDQHAVVIEDLISTGASSIHAANVLREKGVQIEGVLSIFTYELSRAYDAFENEKLNFDSLLNYSDLIEALPLDEESRKILEKWREDMNEPVD